MNMNQQSSRSSYDIYQCQQHSIEKSNILSFNHQAGQFSQYNSYWPTPAHPEKYLTQHSNRNGHYSCALQHLDNHNTEQQNTIENNNPTYRQSAADISYESTVTNDSSATFYDCQNRSSTGQPVPLSYSSSDAANVVNHLGPITDDNKVNNHEYYYSTEHHNSFHTNQPLSQAIEQPNSQFVAHSSQAHSINSNDNSEWDQYNHYLGHQQQQQQQQQNPPTVEHTNRLCSDNVATGQAEVALFAAEHHQQQHQYTDYHSASRFAYMNFYSNNQTTTQVNDKLTGANNHHFSRYSTASSTNYIPAPAPTKTDHSPLASGYHHHQRCSNNYNESAGQTTNGRLSLQRQSTNPSDTPLQHHNTTIVEQQRATNNSTTRLFYTWSTSNEPECRTVEVELSDSLNNTNQSIDNAPEQSNVGPSLLTLPEASQALQSVEAGKKVCQKINICENQQDAADQFNKSDSNSLSTKSTSKPSQQQQQQLKTNQCQVCGRNYARPSTLKTHLRTHTNERPFRCNVCFKTFSQAANLTAHQRVHTGERPFSCPICNRQFSQSSSVITHLRTHSGERPYRCNKCSRTFSDSSTLTKHCRIHSGEKPYQCHFCPLNFSQSGNLSRHLKLHLMGNLQSIQSNISSSLSSSSSSSSSSLSSSSNCTGSKM